LHQVIVGAMTGDAITDEAFLIRRWLREAGYHSDIYAEAIHPALEREVRSWHTYRPHPDEARLIYHHSIGSPAVDRLLALPLRLILIYHNVTPPSFFTSVNPALARQMQLGREQLSTLRARTDLALADSDYNEQDLRQAGFERTGVLPISLDPDRYAFPPNPELQARFQTSGPLLLFVGRLAPNKKQEDLIKLMYFYRRIDPSARLLLAGDPWVPAYDQWLRDLAVYLGLRDSVVFVGHVSQADLVTYYGLADVYVSMSEHEGFGKPLIESMYLGVPVLAYAAAAVRGTLGGAGLLFWHKHYEALAEAVDLLVRDASLRQRIIARQRGWARQFLEPAVKDTWRRLLGNSSLVLSAP
jgi:glycosyltransferase involved in cell wall biosynthesis